jgi:hypothetical protein
MAKMSQEGVDRMRRVLRCLIEHADRTTDGYEIHNRINDEVTDFPEVMSVYAMIKNPREPSSFFITADSPEADEPGITTISLTDDELQIVKDALVFSHEIAEDNRDLYQASKEQIEKSMSSLDNLKSISRKLN